MSCQMLIIRVMWKLLFAFVSLFVFVTPFEILFGCGKKESLEDSFLNSFKLPPLRNSHQKSFFFPLTFNDFVVFLYRTSELNESTTSLDPAFSHLHQSVKSELFQTFFSKNDAAKLSASHPLNELLRNYPKPTQSPKAFEIYSKWWSQSNYLYPFCFIESLVLEKKEFPRGFMASRYGIKNNIFNVNSQPIDTSKRMILKTIRRFRKRNASVVGLSEFVDLQELKFSLFFEFEKCPYIHPLICLVVSNQNNNCTVPMGYLCEEAVLGSLKIFLLSNKIFGNYACFLRELFHIAEAIQFLHDHRIIHNDLHNGNVLIFPDGNEVRMKLIDFGGSKTIEEYKLERKYSLKLMKENYLKNISEPILSESFDERAVFKDDWVQYSRLLSNTILTLKMDEKVEFKEIEKLVDLLKGNDYWELENILQTIREHFDKEIEKCSIEEPFYFERKQVDSF